MLFRSEGENGVVEREELGRGRESGVGEREGEWRRRGGVEVERGNGGGEREWRWREGLELGRGRESGVKGRNMISCINISHSLV